MADGSNGKRAGSGAAPSDTLRILPSRYGRWALVTGASEGIGRELAYALAAEGFDLVLCARRRHELEAVASTVTSRHGVQARIVALDLSLPDAPARLLESAEGLDIGVLVAAAGFGSSGPFVDNPLDSELRMLDVNCRAVLMLTHAIARRFIERKRGAIVLMSSLLAWQGQPFAANYGATKAYIQSLAEGLRVELAPHGVHVLAAAPGPVASGFGRNAEMTMSFAMAPGPVARGIVKAMGRRGTTVPGGLSKLLTYSLFTAPRPLRIMIMTRIMRGMARAS